jgi:hypothetical protein
MSKHDYILLRGRVVGVGVAPKVQQIKNTSVFQKTKNKKQKTKKSYQVSACDHKKLLG